MNKLSVMFAIVVTVGSVWFADRAVDDLPERVDVGGRLLRMKVVGEGSPAVVLEIGLGGPLEVWDLVQPELARHTRVVAYDRVGAVDQKDSLSGEDIARELHAALHRAGIEPPYVLVGQSFGGVYNRLFASMYPDEVAGMVLLDPTHEDFLAWLKVHHPKERLSKHFVRKLASAAGVQETLTQLKLTDPLPDVPVVVVTGTKFIDDPLRIDALPVWTEVHRRWVTSLPQGRHVLASNSGHGVPIEVPDLVVHLVREVVESARRRQAVEGAEDHVDKTKSSEGEP
jgi:pimeloyl-ACP methyl ester carboxylesterase